MVTRYRVRELALGMCHSRSSTEQIGRTDSRVSLSVFNVALVGIQ